ncbi:MAG: site-2 protease family protein [Candidatus Korarchaeum sp.]|nr:site-2 protease family protein [Candidatus Korarchaeum sp.]MDW8036222.1 site-2 protease family protein [Candidatus Korarchaeum sp.]
MIDLGVFLRNLLIFWIALYALGIVLKRFKKLGFFRVGLFYLEISTDPRKFSGLIGPTSKVVGPLHKISVILMVALSIFSSFYLVKITVDSLIGPRVAQIVPVIPGVTLDITLPALLSIFIVLSVHEILGHATLSHYFKVPVRKIAFFILFFLLGAFVEPDEESLRKAERLKKMSIYSAGVFANLVTFLLFLIVTILIFPGFSMDVGSAKPSGVYVERVFESGPSWGVVPEGVIIRGIGSYIVEDLNSLSETLRKFKPGDSVVVVTDRGNFTVKLGSRPEDPSIPYLGVQLHPVPYFDPSIPMPPSLAIQVLEFLVLTMVFNLGLAVINALPILPLDGGLMISEVLARYADESVARKLTWAVSAPFALMLIYNALIFFLG